MLSAVGLALDCVGAVALALVLRDRLRLLSGYGASEIDPRDAAHAHGLCAVGVTLLPLGFICNHCHTWA